jgi:hypothetical protein
MHAHTLPSRAGGKAKTAAKSEVTKADRLKFSQLVSSPHRITRLEDSITEHGNIILHWDSKEQHKDSTTNCQKRANILLLQVNQLTAEELETLVEKIERDCPQAHKNTHTHRYTRAHI